MFDSVFKQDPRNRAVGERYRRVLLQPGGSRDPMEMIRAFLGREPTQDAFLLRIGLAV
jgi:Zn-dependent oligopeptidase